MLDLNDLAMLYDLAKAAPVARAEFSHQVSDLLKKVEGHLAEAVASAKKAEADRIESAKNPAPPEKEQASKKAE